MRRRLTLGLTAAILAVPGIVWLAACRATASSTPLVYICQTTPCSNSQEVAVSDVNGAPIFSVGEYGGAQTYGDNLRVFPPGSVYNPAIVLSWETPDAYADTFNLPDRCAAPAKWIEPAGTWTCQSGAWKRIGP